MRIQYVGTGHIRILSAADMKAIGAEEGKKTTWDRVANEVHEIPDVAGQWLLDNEKGDWKKIEDEPVDVGDNLSTNDTTNQVEATGDPTAARTAAAPTTTGTGRTR